MAKKSSEILQTFLKLEEVYYDVRNLVGKLSKTQFAEIIDKKKQNITTRISYNGYLLVDEVPRILKFLAEKDLQNTDLYFDLSKILNPRLTRDEIKEIKSSDNNSDEDFTALNVRGEVGVSCGYGSFSDNDRVTGQCLVPTRTLREYGASRSHTEVVYAQGDSMLPEINSGDALLVDTSQTEIIDGVMYAFNYEGQPMCKRLRKLGKEIKAISTNPSYEPFIIDFTNQFNVVGRIVGFMRPVL